MFIEKTIDFLLAVNVFFVNFENLFRGFKVFNFGNLRLIRIIVWSEGLILLGKVIEEALGEDFDEMGLIRELEESWELSIALSSEKLALLLPLNEETDNILF